MLSPSYVYYYTSSIKAWKNKVCICFEWLSTSHYINLNDNKRTKGMGVQLGWETKYNDTYVL